LKKYYLKKIHFKKSFLFSQILFKYFYNSLYIKSSFNNICKKFLSLEPLLGLINTLNPKNIDWVIVGNESGPGARPMLEEWVVDIKDEYEYQNVPFFFSRRDGKPKQWCGVNKKKTGRTLKSMTWDEMPWEQKNGR